ncbi:hypothetical protein QW131_24155 [Roseibium salinum]|nr:hypothetical protein [Roseibium salinum]
MTPSLVIFDCDGVLVDTERLANRSMAELVTELGHPMSGQECQQRFMGRTLEKRAGNDRGADRPQAAGGLAG